AVVVVDAGHLDRPENEDRSQPGRRHGESARSAERAVVEVSERPYREEGRRVEAEEQDDCCAGDDGVHAEEVPKAAGEVVTRVQGHTVHQVREPDAPDERGAEAAERVGEGPDPAPPTLWAFRAPLERHDA